MKMSLGIEAISGSNGSDPLVKLLMDPTVEPLVSHSTDSVELVVALGELPGSHSTGSLELVGILKELESEETTSELDEEGRGT
jgi:hypothetical protein